MDILSNYNRKCMFYRKYHELPLLITRNFIDKINNLTRHFRYYIISMEFRCFFDTREDFDLFPIKFQYRSLGKFPAGLRDVASNSNDSTTR